MFSSSLNFRRKNQTYANVMICSFAPTMKLSFGNSVPSSPLFQSGNSTTSVSCTAMSEGVCAWCVDFESGELGWWWLVGSIVLDISLYDRGVRWEEVSKGRRGAREDGGGIDAIMRYGCSEQVHSRKTVWSGGKVAQSAALLSTFTNSRSEERK